MSQLIEQVKHISSGQYPETNKRSLLSGELLEISKQDELSDHRDLLQQAARVISLPKYTLSVKNQISLFIHDLYPILKYYFGGTSVRLEMIISEEMCERRDLVLSNYLREGMKISYSSYYNQHILYAFLTDIDEKRYVIKFGYTYDLASRPNSLRSGYGARFYLIGVKIIAAEKDEKAFHKILKQKHSKLVYDLKVNKTNKKELYYYDPVLMEEYEVFNPSALPEKYWELLTRKEEADIEREKTKQSDNDLLIKKIDGEIERERSKRCDTKLLIKEADIRYKKEEILCEKEKTEQLRLQIELAKLQRKD